MNHPEVAVPDPELLVESDAALQADFRLGEQAEQALGVAQIAKNRGIIGPRFERQPVAARGVQVLAQLQECVAQVVLRFDQFWIQQQRPFVEWYRFADTPERPHRVGGFRKAVGVVRLELQRSMQAHQGLLPTTGPLQCRSEITVRFSIVGQQFRGAAERGQGVLPLTHESHAQYLPHHSVIGMSGQECARVGLGRARAPLIDEADHGVDCPGVWPIGGIIHDNESGRRPRRLSGVRATVRNSSIAPHRRD